VEYNAWYGSGKGKYSDDHLLAEARIAAELGFEVFVIDAGWYGEGPGPAWGKNLGDWRVNRTVFPNGLEPLIREVKRLGMKFGIWFEIECINPNIPLAKKHPDWILRDPEGNYLSTKPNARVVLDFSRPDVIKHVEQVFDDIIGGLQVDYVKLDFNTHPVIDNEKLNEATDPLYRHNVGLHKLLTHLRERHPSVIVENCASGSMRHELSAAALSDTHWISDDTRNQTNLQMSFGASWLFPPATNLHWTVQPTRGNPLITLDAQVVINMMGHFGVSSRLQDWDAGTVAIFKKRTAQYKDYRSLIRTADVYHLTPQRLGVTQAALYVDERSGRALLFAFQGGADELKQSIRLRGLDSSRRYRIGGDVAAKIVDGSDLVDRGFGLSFAESGAALVITLEPLPN
jgi:alpha-galactosidase